MNNKLLLLSGLLTLCFVYSCSNDDDDPVIPLEPEVITTLTYTLTPEGGGNVVNLLFRDLDGDGGNTPEIVGGILSANTTYDGLMELLNETESPAENITDEIKEFDQDHQFFFQQNGGLNLSFAYVDLDGNDNPVGIETKLITGDASTGQLRITLRHEPNKSASGVSNGDITNAGGESDIEVTFDITIQ